MSGPGRLRRQQAVHDQRLGQGPADQCRDRLAFRSTRQERLARLAARHAAGRPGRPSPCASTARTSSCSLSGDVFPAQKWMHMAVTYNGSGLKSGPGPLHQRQGAELRRRGRDSQGQEPQNHRPAASGGREFQGRRPARFPHLSQQAQRRRNHAAVKWAGLRPLLAGDGSKLTAEQRTRPGPAPLACVSTRTTPRWPSNSRR